MYSTVFVGSGTIKHKDYPTLHLCSNLGEKIQSIHLKPPSPFAYYALNWTEKVHSAPDGGNTAQSWMDKKHHRKRENSNETIPPK